MRNHLFAIPIVGNGNHFAVGTYMVVFVGHKGRIVFEMASPRKAHVHIYGVTIPVHFPDTGNGQGLPLCVVEISLVEIGRSLVCVFYIFDPSICTCCCRLFCCSRIEIIIAGSSDTHTSTHSRCAYRQHTQPRRPQPTSSPLQPRSWPYTVCRHLCPYAKTICCWRISLSLYVL